MSEKHTCWFIDFENVGPSRCKAFFKDFGDNDSVFIVYSEVCSMHAVECHRELKSLSVKANMVFSPLNGANALDFVLVSELSRMSVVEADNDYVIVSDDLGFDSVVAYLRSNDISVRRVDTNGLVVATVDVKTDRQPLSDVQRRVLYDFIVTNGFKLKGGRRYQRLNEICQRYEKSTRKANLVYHSLKPILDDKVELHARKVELGFTW